MVGPRLLVEVGLLLDPRTVALGIQSPDVLDPDPFRGTARLLAREGGMALRANEVLRIDVSNL